MGEPARKHTPDIEPEIRPRFGVIQGGGESTDSRANLHSAPDQQTSELLDKENSNVIQGPWGSGDSLQDAEENPSQAVSNGFYNPGNGQGQQKVTLKNFFKKKGPLSIIIALLLGGGAGFSIMFAPAIGIIHLKETLMSDLNDQLAAVDARSVLVVKAKIKSVQAGASVCANELSIRCKFSSFSKKQVTNFEKANFTIQGETKGSRIVVTSLTHTNPDDNTVTIIKDPNQLRTLANTNPALRKDLARAFNPRNATIRDTVASLFTRGTHARLTGSNTEDFKKSVNESIAESTTGFGRERARPNVEAGTVDEDEDIDRPASEETQATRLQEATGNTGSVFAGAAVKGVSVVGALDSACTVKNTANLIEDTSKTLRAAQTAGFAMSILNSADRAKASDSTYTPEMSSFIGDMMTATDTEKEVYNESSALTGSGNTLTATKVANPYYGKSAFDSEGVRAAMYNDAPKLTARAQQYTIGGGLVGTLANINNEVDRVIGPGGQGTCKIVQSAGVRIVGGVVGIFLGVTSGGASLAVSAGASLAVAAALPLLESYLANMIAGKVVDADTKGVDAGNALFAGTGAILGGIAQKRGMKPATKSDLQTYLAQNNSTKDFYVALDREDAASEPLNIYNQYSFLGSLARSIAPVTVKASASTTGAVAAVPSIFSTAFQGLLPSANAVGTYNPERFEQCADSGYEKLEIAADVFCNVRYVMSSEEMNLDTDVVLDYMINNNFIDDTGNAVDGKAYKNWLDECVDREAGWGSAGSTDSGESGAAQAGDGAACMQNTYQGAESKYFRAFTMDKTLQEAMDDEPVVQPTSAQGDGNSTGQYAWPIKTAAPLSRCYGPSAHDGFHYGVDISAKTGTPVYAADGGIVETAGQIPGLPTFGVAVLIKHSNGQWTEYAHNSSVTVKAGDQVSKGQQIAVSGNTGNSTGDHLHWQIDTAKPPLYPSTSNTIDPLTVTTRPANQTFAAGATGCR